MKNAKKFLGLALAATMAATALTGCGSSGDDTWKFGGIGPTTGGAAAYGLGVQRAIEIAVEEVNAAGGINGYQIECKFQDDELDSEKSVNAYNTLKDWGMDVLIGTVTSGCCISVGAVAETDNVFMLTPSATSLDAVAYTNVFQVCFTDPYQGVGSAQYIGMNGLATKVAVIYDSSDAYSNGIYEKFALEAANQPFEIVAAGAFTADNKTDFSVQLQQAKDAGAELIFLPIYYSEAAMILTQAAAMDYAPTFFGCDGLDGILTSVDGFDVSLAEGVLLLTPFAADASDAATQAFVKKYQEKYNDIPNQFAADAYDAVYILKAAIEKGNLRPGDKLDTICETLVEMMTQITVDGLTGENMTWAATGEVNKSPKAMKIVNGAYAIVE